jgi:hypothetical protein
MAKTEPEYKPIRSGIRAAMGKAPTAVLLLVKHRGIRHFAILQAT